MSLNLDLISGEHLKAFAKQLDVLEKTHTKKQDYITAIETCVRLRPRTFVEALSGPEKTLLAEIAHSGRLPDARQFASKYSQPFPTIQGYRYSGTRPSLLVCLLSVDYSGQSVLVPGIAEPFKSFLPAPAPPQSKILSAPPETYAERPVQVFSGERHIAAELGRVLRLIHAGKIKVTDSSRRPTDASTRLIAGALVQPDLSLEPPKVETAGEPDVAGPVRAHAWGVLAQQCGWAKPRSGSLVLTAFGKDILASFTPEKFKLGITQFLIDDNFDELHRINYIRGQTGKAKRWISDPGERRALLEDHVDAWPVGEWLHFNEAFRLLEAAGGSLDVVDTDRGVLYIGDAQYGTIYEGLDLSRQYLRVLVMESLVTLGLVDIAWVYPHGLWPEFKDFRGWGIQSYLSRYDGLLAVRLNALGAYCFDITETFEFTPGEEEKRLHLLANHEIAAVATPDAADVAFLELIATQKSERVWQLDAPTILRSMEQGTPLSDIREFLSNSAREGVPANIGKWLDDLGEKAVACQRVRRAVLLEWSDPVQAHLIATSAGTGKLCHHAGENRIAVAERHRAAFSREARKLGFIIPAAL